MSDPAAKAEALRDAAAKGSLAVLEESIKTNIGDIMSWINDANRRGNTALQLAAMWGHIDCCQALLAAGADKDKASNVRAPRISSSSSSRRSAPLISLGCRAGRAHAANVRRDQGRARRGDPRADQARRRRQPARQRAPPLFSPPAGLAAQDFDSARLGQDGWTALHHAASDGDVVVVRALLEGKASRKPKNEVRAPPDLGLRSAAHVAHRPPTRLQEGKSARKVATEAGNEAAVTLFRQWSLFEGDSDEDEDPADAADDDEADT